MTITRSTITDNLAQGGPGGTPGNGAGFGGGSSGGGIYSTRQSFTLTNSILSGNQAVGGAATAGTGLFPTTDGGNSYGGALYMLGLFEQATIRGATFVNNLAQGGATRAFGSGFFAFVGFGLARGGGASAVYASLQMTDCTFAGNRAFGGAGVAGSNAGAGSDGGDASGGGLSVQGGFLSQFLNPTTISNTNFVNNLARGGTGGNGNSGDAGDAGGGAFGGGLANRDFTTAVSNCSFVRNVAQGGIGGVGGILMEVPSGDILVRGLSMPHSPRWHQDTLWLLESGTGSIGAVDLRAGRPGDSLASCYEPIAELPGFTRGLDFYGNLAFIGLSQVRESAVFSGIPLTERLTERACGVWVVELDTGGTVAFLKFEDAVQEIFAVQVLREVRFPDLINDDPKILANSFILPDDALSQLPDSFRENIQQSS